jgi:hypothetical protein
MGFFDVIFKARLDNVEKVEFPDSMRWFFKILCSNCREEYPKDVYFQANEKVEAQGTRGTFNFVSRCKSCGTHGNLSFVDNAREFCDSEEFKTIAKLEGRGIKILSWLVYMGFNVVSTSGKVFEDVRPDENDWVEYDDRGEFLVGVYEIETRVVEV